MTTAANRSYRLLFWTLAVVGLCLDQGSKYGVFAWLYPPHPVSHYDKQQYIERDVEVIPHVFYLSTTFTKVADPGDTWRGPLRTTYGDLLPEVNHGALWGIGGKNAEGSDFNHVFALVSVVAAVAIVLWSCRRSTATDRWLCMALGLILAGTLGNLYDRVVFLGVRDFLHWVYLTDFPRFNIADSCLVCGAALLLLQAYFTVPHHEKSTALGTGAVAEPTTVAAVRLPQPETADVK